MSSIVTHSFSANEDQVDEKIIGIVRRFERQGYEYLDLKLSVCTSKASHSQHHSTGPTQNHIILIFKNKTV